jgi:hypothetical protein
MAYFKRRLTVRFDSYVDSIVIYMLDPEIVIDLHKKFMITFRLKMANYFIALETNF